MRKTKKNHTGLITKALSYLSGKVTGTASSDDIYYSKGASLAYIEPKFLLTVHGI